jgi:hypothetical protein
LRWGGCVEADGTGEIGLTVVEASERSKARSEDYLFVSDSPDIAVVRFGNREKL